MDVQIVEISITEELVQFVNLHNFVEVFMFSSENTWQQGFSKVAEISKLFAPCTRGKFHKN